MRAHRRRQLVTGAATLALLVGGPAAAATASPMRAATPPGQTSVPARDEINRAAAPELRWRSCGSDFPGIQCARATVPLDYDDPDGATTTLALAKRPAGDPARRIGTVFVNPGGPGGSGVFFVQFGFGDRLDAELDGRFDVVGFDPRGIVASDPIRCFPNQRAIDRFTAGLPIFPYLEAQERPYFDRWASLAPRCLSAGPIARHMSTADVARDMDLLRRAVGDSRLTYLGFSYGSYIGNTYANLFPDKVRALAVDGVLDPRLWSEGRQVDSDRVAAQKVWDELLRLCDAAEEECPFWNGGRSKIRWERLADALRATPFELDDGSVYSYDLLIADALGTSYRPEVWKENLELLDSLADAVESRTPVAAGTSARRAALIAQQRPVTQPAAEGTAAAKEASYPNFLDGHISTVCNDTQYPRTFAAFDAIGDYAVRGSRFGPLWWWPNAPCARWPIAEDRYAGPWGARTSGPVLVVGNYFDPSTAYSGARATAALLPTSRLLSYAGWGHTAYLRSQCVTDAVNAYLVRGTLPPAGTVCPANPNPFLADASTRRTDALLVGAWAWPR